MKIQKTPYYSYKIGNLAKGCQLCVQGLKSVFFCTGLCSLRCFYCPISDKKKNKDVVYINEWPTDREEDIIKEIKLCSSKGVGITGGDPLVKLTRTIYFIKLLKEKFSKNFHIHLYTPLALVNNEKLKKLYNAGLDEIRFHPDINNRQEWNILELAKKYKWDIGVEIPVIPNKKNEIIELIHYLNKIKIDFLNLNELEISDTNAQKLLEMGYVPKDRISYGVKGSEELAMQLLNYIVKNKISLNVHYCTTKLKDKVQLRNRIKNRAKNAREKFDIVTGDGMLIRGAIYLKDLFPDFGYNKKLENLNEKDKKLLIKKLTEIKNRIIKITKIKNNEIKLDENKIRLLTNKNHIKKIKNNLKNSSLKFAVVEEYPTYDSLIVEINFL